MIPILYERDEMEFETYGIGALADAVECVVSEELNGEFFLTLRYPLDGKLFNELKLFRIILSSVGYNRPQPFRIMKVSKTIEGFVEVYAPHVSYQLQYIFTKPFTATLEGGRLTALRLMAFLNQNAETGTDRAGTMSPFSVAVYDSDGELYLEEEYDSPTPRNMREHLGLGADSVLTRMGGELEYDRWRINLHAHRGADEGVNLRYSHDLTGLNYTQTLEGIFTEVFPFWYKEATDTAAARMVMLPAGDRTVKASWASSYPFQLTIPLDLSGSIQGLREDEDPSEWMLRELSRRYLRDHGLNQDKATADISFVPLWQTEEYKHSIPAQLVGIGDVIGIRHPVISSDARYKIVQTEYNVLLNRYERIEVGQTKATLTDAMKRRQGEVAFI